MTILQQTRLGLSLILASPRQLSEEIGLKLLIILDAKTLQALMLLTFHVLDRNGCRLWPLNVSKVAKTVLSDFSNTRTKPNSITNAAIDAEKDQMIHLIKHENPKIRAIWNSSEENEMGRLSQGVGERDKEGQRIKGTLILYLFTMTKCLINKLRMSPMTALCTQ